MKLKAGQRICGKTMIRSINNHIRMLCGVEGYQTAVIFACGQYIHLMERLPVEVRNVYDFDRHLYIQEPYASVLENKDVIFDDVNLNADVIITLHAEKLYPPHLKYPDNNHIMVLDTQPHNGSCTQPEHMVGCELEEFDRWVVADYTHDVQKVPVTFQGQTYYLNQ